MSDKPKPKIGVTIIDAVEPLSSDPITALITADKDAPASKSRARRGNVKKSDRPTAIQPEEIFANGDWLEPPYQFSGLEALIENSTILPQCISAYKNNIVGFGIEIDYRDDCGDEETPDMIDEYNRAQRILDLLSFDCETKDMFGRIVETRERYGTAYIEVIRNLANEVVQIENIKRPDTIRQTVELEPYIEVPFYYKSEPQPRLRKFRKFRQEIGGRMVYFKEFGDPRVMDKRDGEYVDALELKYQANEILDLPIGDKPYGTVRWIGQIMGISGASKAERLNYNYFENGRHIPTMIAINGGTLSENSKTTMRQYMNGIKGEAGQHGFLVMETEVSDAKAGFEDTRNPTVEIKDLSPMLQKDELFQSYLDNVRRKVQSAFQLPDLYVGYTTDFNRATSQTAMEVTEKQVFIPMRRELAWIINQKLLGEYKFRYIEVGFRSPDITNPDDQSKLLNVLERAGGVTPNEAHQLALEMRGETSENFDGDWGNMPLVYAKLVGEKEARESAAEAARTAFMSPDTAAANNTSEQNSDDSVKQPADIEIEKAVGNDELIGVMKAVHALLLDKGGGANA